MVVSKKNSKNTKKTNAETNCPDTATLIENYLRELQNAGIELEATMGEDMREKERRI